MTVAGAALLYAVAAERLRRPLGELQPWLQHHDASVMPVLLLVLGVALVDRRLASIGAT